MVNPGFKWIITGTPKCISVVPPAGEIRERYWSLFPSFFLGEVVDNLQILETQHGIHGIYIYILRLKSVGISWNQHLIAFKCSVVVFPLASLCQLIITWSSIYCTYYIPSKYCMCFANSSWNSANSSWKSATSFWVQKPENRKAQIKRPTPIVRYTLREKIKRGK